MTEFDYELQVWVVDGVIKDCAHKSHPGHRTCFINNRHQRPCTARAWAGVRPATVKLIIGERTNIDPCY